MFVCFGSGGEAELVRRREIVRDIAVADVMSTRERTGTFSLSQPFSEILDAAVHGHQQDFPVLEEDWASSVVGMVTRDEILAAAQSQNSGASNGEVPNDRPTVRDIMKTDFMTLAPATTLFSEGYRALQEGKLRAVPVLEGSELTSMLTV